MGVASSASCCKCKAAGDKYDASGADAVATLSDERIGVKGSHPSKHPTCSSQSDDGPEEDGVSFEEAALVRESWRRALELGEQTVGLLLFKHIFRLAPEALELFPFKAEPNVLTFKTPRLKAHALRVVGVVDTVVRGVGELRKLTPVLQELGLRHYGYGVRQVHYGVVGQALMLTLQGGLREAFTAEVEKAWSKVWDILSRSMRSGTPTYCAYVDYGSEDCFAPQDTPSFEKPALQGKLSDAEVALIKQSWATAATPGTEAVGILLFRHIFSIAPEALELFPFRDEADVYASARLKAHAAKVVSTVDMAVSSLETIEDVVCTLEGLGRRHCGYGVLPPHYDVVGRALAATLREGLGKAFTPELESAWMKAWAILSAAMMGGGC